MRARTAGLGGLVLLAALAAWILPGGSGEDRPPSPVAALGPGGDERPRWFPVTPGREWRFRVSVDGRDAGVVTYRCVREQGDAYRVHAHTTWDEPGRFGAAVDDIGYLVPGPGDAWRYSKGYRPGRARRVFLPEEPTPGTTWEVRPGHRARVAAVELASVPGLEGVPEVLRVEYRRADDDGAAAGSGEPYRVRELVRGVGIVREEVLGEGGRRVMVLEDWSPG